MAATGRFRAFLPGMPMRFCASCRRTLRFRPSAPQRPVQPRGTPFFRQNAELLPTTLPDALRGVSSLLLTDLTALDYDALGRTLEFLANNGAAVEAQALPGRWDAASGTYTVTDASRAAVQTFFNVSPTEAQASSFKEP